MGYYLRVWLVVKVSVFLGWFFVVLFVVVGCECGE